MLLPEGMSLVPLICCFLHVYIKSRDRGRIKYKDIFAEAASKLWDCYNAENKRSFSQRIRVLVTWAENQTLPDIFINVFKNYKKTGVAILLRMIIRKLIEPVTCLID